MGADLLKIKEVNFILRVMLIQGINVGYAKS